MSIKWSISYDVVTEESATQGDTSESGYWMPGHWQYILQDDDGHHEGILKEAMNGDYDQKGTLSDMIDQANELGIIYDGCSFSSVDPDIDFMTGEYTTYYLHCDRIDEQSKDYNERIASEVLSVLT